MAEPVRLGLDEGEALAFEALVASRTSPANARATARTTMRSTNIQKRNCRTLSSPRITSRPLP